MTWRERLALLLGAASPFAVSGAAAAEPPNLRLQDSDGAAAVTLQRLDFWSDPAHSGHLLQLAGHRSHSSHSSHRSHSSHVSGSGHSSHYSGSSVTTPAPLYSPPAPYVAPRPAKPATPAPLYSPPARSVAPPPVAPRKSAPAPQPSSSPPPVNSFVAPRSAEPSRLNQDDITKFVQRVQIALMVKGYDPGPADGDLKPQTREALRAFQTATGLSASGNMDMPTLHALGVLK